MEKKQSKAARMLERLENRHAELISGIDALNLRVNEALERYCITPTTETADKSSALSALPSDRRQ